MATSVPVTCSTCNGCIFHGSCMEYGNGGPPNAGSCIQYGGTNCGGTMATSAPVTCSTCNGCIIYGSCKEYGYGGPPNAETCIQYGGTNCGGTVATPPTSECSSCKGGCITSSMYGNSCIIDGINPTDVVERDCTMSGGTYCPGKCLF